LSRRAVFAGLDAITGYNLPEEMQKSKIKYQKCGTAALRQ
jgi:hypothetical protein